jgi:hypothetical protein
VGDGLAIHPGVEGTAAGGQQEGFDLDGFPAVRAWLERVAAQPGHVPITHG